MKAPRTSTGPWVGTGGKLGDSCPQALLQIEPPEPSPLGTHHQPAAVPAHRQRIERVGNGRPVGEVFDDGRGGDVPDPQRAVAARRDQAAPVGGEDQRTNADRPALRVLVAQSGFRGVNPGASQRITFPSRLPEARSLPAGSNARQRTALRWPMSWGWFAAGGSSRFTTSPVGIRSTRPPGGPAPGKRKIVISPRRSSTP